MTFKKDLSSTRHTLKTIFACQAYPTHTAAGRGWFAELGRPLVEYAASLRFQTSALTRKAGEANSFDIRIPKKMVEPVGIEPTT